MLAVIAVTCWVGWRAGPERARRGGRVLGVGLLVFYAIEGFVRVTWLHMPPILLLPGELCNALFFIGAYALLTDSSSGEKSLRDFSRRGASPSRTPPSLRRFAPVASEVAHELLFFWTFAGTVHSLITPTPLAGWPSVEYVRFFASHGLLILCATYAVIALERVVTWRSLVRAAIALQVWELLVAIVDVALDQNFMFLRRPPPSPTLFDALGPWPIYLVWLEVIALVSFALWLGAHGLLRRVLPVRAP